MSRYSKCFVFVIQQDYALLDVFKFTFKMNNNSLLLMMSSHLSLFTVTAKIRKVQRQVR